MEEPINAYNEYQQNKYIYFKQNHPTAPKGTTILVNPHFRDKTKVFINPNFPISKMNRPNIHVNPNVINISTSVPPATRINLKTTQPPLKTLSVDSTEKVVVSTKNKLVKVHLMSKRVPELDMSVPQKNACREVLNPKKHQEVKNLVQVSGPYKKVNVPMRSEVKHRTKKITRMKVINVPKLNDKLVTNSPPKSSMHSRYKLIRNGAMIKKVDRKVLVSRHKIINISQGITQQKPCRVKSPNVRKRFVYVNRYNSSSFLANNVILKNTNRRSLIKINGMFYKNSPSALKKTNIILKQDKDLKNESIPNTSEKKCIVKYIQSRCKQKLSPNESFEHYHGGSKLVRCRVASISKLKKSNVPCAMFKRFGKCNGQKKGTCFKIHNPDQIVLCPRFLIGACVKENCLLSHKVSPEKMPTCKYFLDGLCSRDDCQYSHVKINPNADICRDFLAGFCQKGNKCNCRHQFLCPEFEKTKNCSKRRCEYPHIQIKTTFSKTRKHITKNRVVKKTKKPSEQNPVDKAAVRYYVDASEENNPEETLISKRPKLGSLPSYIPLLSGVQADVDESSSYSSFAGEEA